MNVMKVTPYIAKIVFRIMVLNPTIAMLEISAPSPESSRSH